MKTKMLLPALTTALALSAGATPAAWALQTEWVATGTVYNSYDYTGVFGLAGSSLDGDRFTADFYIDTSKGTEDRVPGFADEVYGGTEFGNLTPVSATLTINGVTESFSGSDYGAAYIDSPAEVFCDVDSNNYENELFAELEPGTGGVASVIGQTFSLTGNDSDGDFQLYDSDVDSGPPEVSGTLTVNTFSSTGVLTSAAPEPSAWALMIAGVGMAGATLRLGRRRGWAPA